MLQALPNQRIDVGFPEVRRCSQAFEPVLVERGGLSGKPLRHVMCHVPIFWEGNLSWGGPAIVKNSWLISAPPQKKLP